MATVFAIGQPENEDERLAIRWLREKLPLSYEIYHNFEIERDGQKYEIDLAILAPNAVWLVDAKGTRGNITVYGTQWHPEGRSPFASPLPKLRQHAKSLRGMLLDSNRGRPDLDRIHFGAAIILTAPDAELADTTGYEAGDVCKLKDSANFLQDGSRIPNSRLRDIRQHIGLIRSLIKGKARPRTSSNRLGDYVLEQKLGETDHYVEWRGYNESAGLKSGKVRLRVYRADPYLPESERIDQKKRIQTAYTALNRLPSHPNILGARHFFGSEGEDRFVLVTEDVVANSLRLHLDKANLALTFDQKMSIAQELLSALAHCHANSVIHRAVSPTTVLVAGDGRVRLHGFEFARVGSDRSITVAREAADTLDRHYFAPECVAEMGDVRTASDIFAAGLVIFEMMTGDRPFQSPTELVDLGAHFRTPPSAGGMRVRHELPPGFDEWLQTLCDFDWKNRPNAEQALSSLTTLLDVSDSHTSTAPDTTDYNNLPQGTMLDSAYQVQERLGKPGAFGVAYRVIDTYGDVDRVIKLITRDRHSKVDRLKQEYRILVNLPRHRHVVQVLNARQLPDGTPFLVFEYVDGVDVQRLLDDKRLSGDDALLLGKQVLDGLAHLHAHNVFHLDIKPRNLLWSRDGVRIIDFNVAAKLEDSAQQGGGSRRYIPADFDLVSNPTVEELRDRDLFALGVTLYESITGSYPWAAVGSPIPGQAPQDPRTISGLADLSPILADVLMRACAAHRAARFRTTQEFLEALSKIERARVAPPPEPAKVRVFPILSQGPVPPNTNPYVNHLLTVYSQSRRSNSGTRGLDQVARWTYVDTALDRTLTGAALNGEFRLILISGNAGDGKTAFLQQLENTAKSRGAKFEPPGLNGCEFTIGTRAFKVNYDGSQDEGETPNEQVLLKFFDPFTGTDDSNWPPGETRLIAINEGKLVDFLTQHRKLFPLLSRIVEKGLRTSEAQSGVLVVNLNLRSVVSDGDGQASSIFERTLRKMVDPALWQPCESCDLRDKCYARFNALTLQDPVAGPQVIERLKTLFTLTHLRGLLHITLRDLRSALAYMLVGTYDCQEIHNLYTDGKSRRNVLDGFYFNSIFGGQLGSQDRLLSLLRNIDVSQPSDPQRDRALDFLAPVDNNLLLRPNGRSVYIQELLNAEFDSLPRDLTSKSGNQPFSAHQAYLAVIRRWHYFERRDEAWKAMLPYRSAGKLLKLIASPQAATEALPEMIAAINRGEKLFDPTILGGDLALSVREVERGTVRNYRVFERGRFELEIRNIDSPSRFLEQMPDGLNLTYKGEHPKAQLEVNLDVFELLERLNDGYRPTVEEVQGFYLRLAVFKNSLAAAPYQEILLTDTGHEFHSIKRTPDGVLKVSRLEAKGA
ncbi:MAG: protein kinase [Bryobacter sp.]|jgi:serine/threonine protein kinase|nr:protein kinase [Bryobacter sp. CoA8 C33]